MDQDLDGVNRDWDGDWDGDGDGYLDGDWDKVPSVCLPCFHTHPPTQKSPPSLSPSLALSLMLSLFFSHVLSLSLVWLRGY